MENLEQELKKYQIILLFSPLLELEKIKEIVQKIKTWIEEKAGKIEKQGEPIKKKLAQPIQKNQEAFYLDLDFQLSGADLPYFQKELNLEKEIIRYLINIKKKEKPVVSLRQKFVSKPRREEMNNIGKISPETHRVQTAEKTERKVKIEEIDKKLEEILNE